MGRLRRLQASNTIINGNAVVGLQILVHEGQQRSSTKVHSFVINKSMARWWIEPVLVGHPHPVPSQFPESRFLQACQLCHKKLSPENDVYMYRGDHAYCSIDCRNKQILTDEMKEGEAVRAKTRRSPCRRRLLLAHATHRRLSRTAGEGYGQQLDHWRQKNIYESCPSTEYNHVGV